MIVFRIPCFLSFLLIVNFCAAQNRSYNTIFDSLVTHDQSIPVSAYTGSWPAPKKQVPDTLKQRLGNKEYTDIQKFRYLQNLSCNTIHHLPKAVADSVERWKPILAKKIIEDMFLRGWDRDDEWYEIVDAVPVKSELLEDYFNKWPTLKEKKRHDERIFYWLVQGGREEAALNWLKLMVADYVAGKEWWYMGNRFSNTNMFDLLCFSKNNTVRAEAIKLVWTCLEYKDDHRLLNLGLYLDEATGIKYLQKWFWYYASQKQEPAPNEYVGRRYRETPKAISSLGYLIHMYSPWLMKAMGAKQLWTEVAVRMPYWKAYVGIVPYFQLPVLETIFTDSSLTTVDKQQILLGLTDNFYPENATRLQYLQLVKQAWPDGNLSEYAFTKLNLCDMATWQKPVVYPEYTPCVFDLHNAIADIKKAGIGELNLNTDYWQFLCSLNGYDFSDNRLNHNFHHVFNQTGLVRKSEVASWSDLGHYTNLFNETFGLFLLKIGIRDIEVYEKVNKKKDRYRLYVRSNEGAYTMTFKTAESGELYPQPLVKMINLLLMKKGVKERLIELESHYSGLQFGLFEPDKARPLLDKYNVRCFAVGYGVDMSAWRKTELK